MQRSTNPRTLLAGCGARILIVDSDVTFSKFFKIHLSRFFSDVFATGNPKEALSWFEHQHFDLVIVDLNLPRIGGLAFTKRLRKLEQNVSIILMTDAQLSEEQRAKIDKRDGVLSKPFSMDEFHVCVRKGLNEKLCKSKVSKEARAEAGAFFEDENSPTNKQKVS